MKTRYRFIHFTERTGPDGAFWECANNRNGCVLGYCNHYPSWNQWVFEQSGPGVVFSADCLQDIAHFMGQLPKP